MSLSKFVKVSHVSNLSDARYCAGMMVDILGFEIADNSKDHFVSAQTFTELTEWVAGVSFCGEFGNSDCDKITELLHNYAVQYIESTSLDVLKKLTTSEKELIYRLKVLNQDQVGEFTDLLISADEIASIIVIDSELSENYQIEKMISELRLNAKLLKAYDVTVENIPLLAPYWDGVELQGEVEDQPGFKDFGEIMDILEALEVD